MAVRALFLIFVFFTVLSLKYCFKFLLFSDLKSDRIDSDLKLHFSRLALWILSTYNLIELSNDLTKSTNKIREKKI